MELIPFIPLAAGYQIWHPEDFLVTEASDRIVTITSPVTNSNLTVSGYHADKEVTESILTDFFARVTRDYTPTSELKIVETGDKIWLEGEFKRNGIFWVWWVLSSSNHIIMASVNSSTLLDPKDRHLFTFMLDKMEIYPVEFED